MDQSISGIVFKNFLHLWRKSFFLPWFMTITFSQHHNDFFSTPLTLPSSDEGSLLLWMFALQFTKFMYKYLEVVLPPSGGDQNFFPLAKGGTRIFLRIQRGDQKKSATGNHSPSPHKKMVVPLILGLSYLNQSASYLSLGTTSKVTVNSLSLVN